MFASQPPEGDGRKDTVWVGTSKGLIRVYNPDTNAKIDTLAGHGGGVYCLSQARPWGCMHRGCREGACSTLRSDLNRVLLH